MFENVKLFHGDCLSIMQNIQSGSVDMILCDLPYGTTACKWDNVIPFDPMREQYRRIIKDNGAIVLFGAEKRAAETKVIELTIARDLYREEYRELQARLIGKV